MRSLAIHGGSGTLSRKNLTPKQEEAYHQELAEALQAGWRILENGGAALDAVQAAVRKLEDCPLFNAGRGSVLNCEGRVEMDAAIMCGRFRKAGAVAAVTGVRNPVEAARHVLEDERYVFLVGDGARTFAIERGCVIEQEEFFHHPERLEQLEAARRRDTMVMDHDKFGTVGAVACDLQGNLAAATSTGGLTNKKYGRVGDSPVIGSGTFASNESCAVSCTGYGEEFIRQVVAHDVHGRMLYGKQSLEKAAHAVIHEALVPLKGQGGLIAVDREGNLALPFNTEGMYRGWINELGESGTGIY